MRNSFNSCLSAEDIAGDYRLAFLSLSDVNYLRNNDIRVYRTTWERRLIEIGTNVLTVSHSTGAFATNDQSSSVRTTTPVSLSPMVSSTDLLLQTSSSSRIPPKVTPNRKRVYLKFVETHENLHRNVVGQMSFANLEREDGGVLPSGINISTQVILTGVSTYYSKIRYVVFV